jgi:hypothetical protein
MEKQRTEIDVAQNTVYITGTVFTQIGIGEMSGVIVAAQSGACRALVAALWGQWSNEAAQ